MNGKSCSHEHPDGMRRIVNGHTLAPRSKRRTEKVTDKRMRWMPTGPGRNDGTMYLKAVVSYKSLVFLD